MVANCGKDLFFWSSPDFGEKWLQFPAKTFFWFLVFIQFRQRKYIIWTKLYVKLVKAAKASPHAKFYNLSTGCNRPQTLRAVANSTKTELMKRGWSILSKWRKRPLAKVANLCFALLCVQCKRTFSITEYLALAASIFTTLELLFEMIKKTFQRILWYYIWQLVAETSNCLTTKSQWHTFFFVFDATKQFLMQENNLYIIGRAVTHSFLKRKVWNSNLGLVNSDTVLPTVRYLCYIFWKGAVLPGHNDMEMHWTDFTLRHITSSIMKDLIWLFRDSHKYRRHKFFWKQISLFNIKIVY